MKKKLIVILTGFMFVFALAFTSRAHVNLPSQQLIHASKSDVKSILAFYDGMEKALKKKDLNAIMKFYADDYYRQGITKSIIKELWRNIFKNFDRLSSTHAFFRIDVKGNRATIVCTAQLLGVPKGDKKAGFVEVDRWQNVEHTLARKGGRWQIVGGASHWRSEFHPLF